MSKSKNGDKSKESQKENNKPETSANYEVGKGKPPKETQFKPGQSGNPTGRPKGSTNLKKLVYEMGAIDMDITGPEGMETVTRNVAIAHKLWSMAMSGNLEAVKFLYKINEECYAKRGEGRMTQQEYEAQTARKLAKMVMYGHNPAEFDQLLDDPGMGRTVVPNNYKDEDDD